MKINKPKNPSKKFPCLLMCIQEDNCAEANLKISAWTCVDGTARNGLKTNTAETLVDFSWEKIKEHPHRGGYRVLFLKPKVSDRPQLGILSFGKNGNYFVDWRGDEILSLRSEVIAMVNLDRGDFRARRR